MIALDIMHDQMKYENAVDVLGCVTSLRAQRNFMVQTEEQYVFVYSALLEMAEGGYTEVSARGLYAQFTSLLQTDSMGFSGFDLEFKNYYDLVVGLRCWTVLKQNYRYPIPRH
ncbi:unnamed protein product [Dibothriocephalus latus]|uniref:Tyrosine-protein phosphatase domain-containing protein n=1 Tax=Dibothriocephalus latus TaxID=60516 RepID=A0A3P7NCW3_DIBLA|nr:unnamed protein product [Dibothriocephalus latus]